MQGLEGRPAEATHPALPAPAPLEMAGFNP